MLKSADQSLSVEEVRLVVLILGLIGKRTTCLTFAGARVVDDPHAFAFVSWTCAPMIGLVVLFVGCSIGQLPVVLPFWYIVVFVVLLLVLLIVVCGCVLVLGQLVNFA